MFLPHKPHVRELGNAARLQKRKLLTDQGTSNNQKVTSTISISFHHLCISVLELSFSIFCLNPISRSQMLLLFFLIS
jgi:hypothetical protein